MTTYRKFPYKSQPPVYALILFAWLAQYAEWHMSPEGQKAHMDAIHREALAEHAQWKREQIMSLWNITEADLAKPVDLFNERGKL